MNDLWKNDFLYRKTCIYNEQDHRECFYERLHEAEKIYNLGYRKIPDGSVVLSKEGYERLTSCIKSEEEVRQIAQEIIKLGINTIRKETAKEIIKDFALTPRTRAMIANKYGLTKEDLGELWTKKKRLKKWQVI